MLNPADYRLDDPSGIDSPGLIYYIDIIQRNTALAIEMAGGAGRLWPHVKSHKCREMIRMQRQMGIRRFKCATIAEVQMTAECGAEYILLAYPLVGPNIRRYLMMMDRFPGTAFYAIGDDLGQLTQLSDAAQRVGRKVPVLLDLNMGMNRTGVPLGRAEALYRAAAGLPGIQMVGLHGYDGHRHEPTFDQRRENAQDAIATVRALRDTLEADGLTAGILVMGGTPTFPVHAEYGDVFLSPGTVFQMDYSYHQGKIHDLPFTPGVAVLARVVSHPAQGLFTIDVGNKAIACEMPGLRALVLGYEDAEPLTHSEEHWVYRQPQGKPVPPIGEVIYLIPWHVCPTNALHAYATVAQGGKAVDRWDIAARNRNIGG